MGDMYASPSNPGQQDRGENGGGTLYRIPSLKHMGTYGKSALSNMGHSMAGVFAALPQEEQQEYDAPLVSYSSFRRK